MEAEDTTNMWLDDFFFTKRDGKQLRFNQVFVRGKKVYGFWQSGCINFICHLTLENNATLR